MLGRVSHAFFRAQIRPALRSRQVGFISNRAQRPAGCANLPTSQLNNAARITSTFATATQQEAVTMTAQARTIYRKDYKPTPYLIDSVDLAFNLNEDVTRVVANMVIKSNHPEGEVPEMFLNGRNDVVLESVSINGTALGADDYVVTDKSMTIKKPPAGSFKLEIVTVIKPQENTLLEGLYKSGGNFCTQCEAEGFRGITYFYDRPDVMAKYTTRIEADKALYPVLLSNGNLVEDGDLPGGRHFTVWKDPWPKPCYLFALVAGKLSLNKDTFTTMSGKQVELRIYVVESQLNKTAFAMESLKKSMKWDEERFGLEYDLDLFNIVAVDDFNMGAMENKSLNVFNSRLILASPQTASDSDFERIEGVVGHEYFHNWTGNRVTCRDWFQLTLKEGLTVYRDSEFTSDMASRPVKRIADVQTLRASQFPEDAGATAHPVRPDSYIKMDNFYTATVYEKGCEVVRMYDTVLGRAGFRAGMDLYFKRHDGQAVTCDDFLAAMADSSGEDFSALARWYGQAGTPELTLAGEYNAAAKTYTVTATQVTPPTKGAPEKVPVMIPIKLGLLGPDGKDMPFKVAEGRAKVRDEGVVLIAENAKDTFVLSGVESKPVPSFLRDFSAPVKLTVVGQTTEDLNFLLAHDSDPFNRWDAGQCLTSKLVLEVYRAASEKGASANIADCISGEGATVLDFVVESFRAVLKDTSIDGSTAAMTVALPTLSVLYQATPSVNPVLMHAVRKTLASMIAARLVPELRAVVKANEIPSDTPYSPDAASAAKRAYKNRALAMLCSTGDAQFFADALAHFRQASNMTDQIAAVGAVIDSACPERDIMVKEFYEAWKHEPLVVLKWLTLQAMSNKEGNVAEVRALTEHSAFNINNPNNCYSLFLRFTGSAVNFHSADGSGYEFMADSILRVDSINRQVAARMANAFTSYKQFNSHHQGLIQAQLKRILAHEGLSENTFEICSKSLESA